MKADTYEVHGTCLTTDGRLALLVDVEECGHFTFLTNAVTVPGEAVEVDDIPGDTQLVAFSPGWPNNPLFTGDWYPMVDAS